jgi:hypothetical protein
MIITNDEKCKCFSYYPSVDGNWGGIADAEKNYFNGMIGMLQRKVRLILRVGQT